MGTIKGGSMGLGRGLENPSSIPKQKHRWLFFLTDVSADGIDVLPPVKAARPSISFKENEVQHLNEIIYYPGKPEWKTITLQLYDICSDNSEPGEHPVMTWLKLLFDPQSGSYNFIIGDGSGSNFKLDASIELYDGCGNCLEKWMLDNCWPQACDFQDLDMGVSEVVLAEMTIRYDRAYIVNCDGGGGSGGGGGPTNTTPNSNLIGITPQSPGGLLSGFGA